MNRREFIAGAAVLPICFVRERPEEGNLAKISGSVLGTYVFVATYDVPPGTHEIPHELHMRPDIVFLSLADRAELMPIIHSWSEESIRVENPNRKTARVYFIAQRFHLLIS